MQATRVKIGGEYAVRHNGQLARFRVTGQTTYRDGSTATNTFHGFIELDDGSKPVEAKFKVEDMLDEYTRYKELVDKQKAEAERKAQAERDRQAKKRRAVDALTDVLGLKRTDWQLLDGNYSYGSEQQRKKRDYESSLLVAEHFSGEIKISEKAFDLVIEKLGAKETV